MKRILDIIGSALGLLLAFPILAPVMFLIWKQDGHSPFYIAPRIGKSGKPFKMVKLRSMIIHADKSGIDSTGANDQRITKVGHFIRRYKLDELSQLWNVLVGDMSLVGPRPNVQRETDLYTPLEKRLLSVKPGITDFASIVFSDEGEILKDADDPDIAYNQLIRPGKGYLGLFYIDHQSLLLDVQLCLYTVIAILSREKAIICVSSILERMGAKQELITLAKRTEPLKPMPPPGASEVVIFRQSLLKS